MQRLAAIDWLGILVAALLRRRGSGEPQEHGGTGQEGARGSQSESSCHDSKIPLICSLLAGVRRFIQAR
jgi:hypothetical protein